MEKLFFYSLEMLN